MSSARIGWIGYAVVAAGLAALGIWHWIWALTLRGPVMYGEGAVANAAILARGRLEYLAGARWGDADPIFTAANYPPLYLHVAALGNDPFITGRVVSLAATLSVAGAIAWRARSGGWLTAVALALAWLGSVPVLQWGSAVKPDLVALALTVGAVVALDLVKPRHALAGALIGFAAVTKPTALLPAAAMFVFVARRDPRAALRALGSGIAAVVITIVLTGAFSDVAILHVISWNALTWRLDLAVALLLLALALFGMPLLTIVLTRPSTTIVTAYAIGSLGIVVLGGREGATINYLLDLSAALSLALAGRASTLASSPRYPIAGVLQAVIVIALLNPFGLIPGRAVTTGAWGDPARYEAIARIPGTLLVEDSGLLVRDARQPVVDDVFLWSRNRAREVAGQLSFTEGQRLIEAVRAGRFDAVVTEVDLSALDAIGGYERQRWHPDLVTAVLERYALVPSPDRHPGSVFVYTRR